MKKTKIFIDFDGTVFNTQKLKERMFGIMLAHGISQEEILDAYKAECEDYKFDPNGFVDRLRTRADKQAIKSEIKEFLADLKDYIFPDVVFSMKRIDREKYELNLLTLGDIAYQQAKVLGSGISYLFDKVYYTDEQKWEYLPKIVSTEEKIIFLDDRADTVMEISKLFPRSIALQIKREDADGDDPTRISEITCEPKETGLANLLITDLSEFMSYL